VIDSLEKTAVPEQVRSTLVKLSADLKAAAGSNLVGLILYGGLARGRFLPGRSDINLVVLLSDASIASLQAISPVLHQAWRASRVEPLLLTPGEVAGVATNFPTKFLDIKKHRVVLWGDDPFVRLEVPREHVRLRIEQELRNLALRLRRRFVAIAQQPASQNEALATVARPLALELASLLSFAGKDVPAEDRSAAVFDLAAGTFALDREALGQLAQLRQNPQTTVDATNLYGRIMQSLDKAIDAVTQMKEARP
jgi:hypothetical protein